MHRVGWACCAALWIGACGGGGPTEEPRTDDAGATADAGVIADPPDADGGAPDAGSTSGGEKRYGEACSEGAECASGECVGTTDVPSICTRTCDIDQANDCRDENTFCVSFTEGDYCFGAAIETGNDASDDEVVNLGDCVTRSLAPLGDADMFLVPAGRSADLTILAEPLNPAIDLAADFYNNGQLVGRSDMYGPGGSEGLRIADFVRGSRMQVVIRDAGSTVSDEYRLCAMLNE